MRLRDYTYGRKNSALRRHNLRWDEEPSSFHSRFSKHLVYVSASSNNNKYGGIENFIRTGHCHLTAVVQCFSWDL